MTNVWVIGLPKREPDKLTKKELHKIEFWGASVGEYQLVTLPPIPANQEQLKAFIATLKTSKCTTVLLDKDARPIRHIFELLKDSDVRVLQVNGALKVLTGFDEWDRGLFATCEEGETDPLPEKLRRGI